MQPSASWAIDSELIRAQGIIVKYIVLYYVLQLHTILVVSSCACMPLRRGAFCALNRLFLLLKQKLSPLCDCRDLHKDQTTLLLYLLLHRNPNVATFILSRTDIDNLVSVLGVLFL